MAPAAFRMCCTIWCVAAVTALASAKAAPQFGADFAPSTADNMNGEYVFSSTPGGNASLFPKRYADYPGGVEYYDVYSPPITTLYSQVPRYPPRLDSTSADVLQPLSFDLSLAFVGHSTSFNAPFRIAVIELCPCGKNVTSPRHLDLHLLP